MNNALKILTLIVLVSSIVFSSHGTQAQDTISLTPVTAVEDSIRIPAWRARLIAQDLIRFDFLKVEYLKLQLDLQDQQIIAQRTEHQLGLMNGILLEKERQLLISEQMRANLQQQVDIWQSKAKGFRRQRNFLAVAGTVLVGGAVYYQFIKK